MNYPRPQLRRKEWQSLDGEWLCNGERVNVPGCQVEELLGYEKTFTFHRFRKVVLLHFGAADQMARVYLNNIYLGEHTGGYLPFEFDISGFAVEGENTLRVIVKDTLDHTYPYGKQRRDHGGMWYTPVSGIWQSVWIEQVPERYIKSVRITPDLTGADLEILIADGGTVRMRKERLVIEAPVLWTPEEPKLYTRTITEGEDRAEIYFALRKIDIRCIDGVNRVCLNGKPVFLHGILDQGYFYPGLFCPEAEDAYEKDVAFVKRLGFNMIRKHIKIEPEEFYYQCDRQGILVLQDMVNSGEYRFFRDTVLGTLGVRLSDRKEKDARMTVFEDHSKKTLEHLYNHPCVIAYTIFNEGWGQFNSDEMYEKLKALDPSRLYDSASGWFRQEKSDFDSEHIYFRLKKLKPEKRPLLISECGGYSLNLGDRKNSYGYGKCHSREGLTRRIEALYEKMILPAIPAGCCGAVYTQLSDIEDEINGLITFDRKTVKAEEQKMAELGKKLRSQLV